MNKKIGLPFIIVALAALASFSIYTFYFQLNENKIASQLTEGLEETELSKELRIKEGLEYFAEITKDEALGYVPKDRIITAIDHTRRRQQEMLANYSSRDGLEDARWRERGPNNIGGRTRAILIDKADPTRKKVWAGGVSGGLWYTNDIDASNPQWLKVNDYLGNLAVGAIAQDPNNTDIMYMGTGEVYTGDGVGFGIFKSTDNGVTWELLPSTALSTTNNLQYTQSMLVHPVTSDVYAATSRGLYRSSNEGDSWQKVLGSGAGSSDFFNDIHYVGGMLWASTDNRAYKSATGDLDDWAILGAGFGNFPSGWQRVEMTICESDPNFVYIIGRNGGSATKVNASVNGGATFSARSLPTNDDGSEFTNGQAWYDLDIAVNPFNCQEVIVGGVTTMQSPNGGLTFERINEGHSDQHYFLYDNEVSGRILIGNDGGVYTRSNGGNGPILDKNSGYNVTQFYAGALHPEAYSNYILGGTQDNSSLQMDGFGISSARVVLVGDGMFCHIDQDDGLIQVVSSQYGNYSISTDGGNSYSGGVSVNGSFVNISDYDNDTNVLYTQTNDGDLYRYFVNASDGESGIVTLNGVSDFSIRSIHADPNTPNRIYLGSTGGRIYRVDNAHDGMAVEAVQLPSAQGTIVSIDIEYGNADHILLGRANFGATNSIFESFDGGQTWVGVEGIAVPNNLPDVPVYWAVFHPDDATQAMIATEVGVWSTEQLDGDNTVWYPPFPGRGTPLVRTDMLQVRRSDRVVLAATYGRGMWTSDVWSDPKAIFAVQKVGYVDGDILFNGSASINASEYDWDLGDGTTSIEEDFLHRYNNIGEYDITLTINDDVNNPEFNVDGAIKILPNRPLPYKAGEESYGGSFESNPEQWGVDNKRGSGWSRGISLQDNKNGTKTGDNAFVIEKDEAYYQNNSEAYLYMPNFDFSDNGLYEFSFYAKYDIGGGGGRDGFNVEYSTDKGLNWQTLGSTNDLYNYANEDFGIPSPFAFGTPFITGTSSGGFSKFKMNITDLAGNENVAIRFVFRSGSFLGNYAGVAIDDVVVSRFPGEPRTAISQQSAEFVDGQSTIDVKWTTLPEYYASHVEVYLSDNGRFVEDDKKETLPATGVVTTDPQNYSVDLSAPKEVYFVQLISYSLNETLGVMDTLRPPVMIVRRDILEGTEILNATNPVVEDMNIVFNNFVTGDVTFELFDYAGRLLYKEAQAVDGIFTSLDLPNLATGAYFLRYTIGDQEAKVYPILKIAN